MGRIRPMAATLVPLKAWWDVPPEWRETPVGDLIAYHSLGRPLRRHERAALLIGTCMDGRIVLRIPEGFAYVLRTAGANLAAVAGNVSYVLGAKGVSFVAVVGHTGCGATNLPSRREELVDGLVVRAGWARERAERHVDEDVLPHGIDDPAEFAFREARWLEREYGKVRAAPLLYDTHDGSLALIRSAG